MTETLIMRTRPTVVEARRLTQDNRLELAHWVRGWTFGVNKIEWINPPARGAARGTRGAEESAEVGEWIVRCPNGDFKPVPDSVLFSQYERVLPEVRE